VRWRGARKIAARLGLELIAGELMVERFLVGRCRGKMVRRLERCNSNPLQFGPICLHSCAIEEASFLALYDDDEDFDVLGGVRKRR